MAGDRQVIFKNEASRINEASKMLYKNEVTAVEAHYVYKILRTVIAYAESSVDPMNNDGIYFPKRKPADFTEILRSLYLWYNNVSEAVQRLLRQFPVFPSLFFQLSFDETRPCGL